MLIGHVVDGDHGRGIPAKVLLGVAGGSARERDVVPDERKPEWRKCSLRLLHACAEYHLLQHLHEDVVGNEKEHCCLADELLCAVLS